MTVLTVSTEKVTISSGLPLAFQRVVDLTINFYRRNYIEGLFLSSGVVRNPDYTMERLAAIARDLRLIHKFNGYIHLKAIPGASKELIYEAGIYADRLSVNIEIPTESNLKLLAPDKNYDDTLRPMLQIKNNIIENKEERKIFRSAPRFAPGGQSTQLIIGASPEKRSSNLKSGIWLICRTEAEASLLLGVSTGK